MRWLLLLLASFAALGRECQQEILCLEVVESQRQLRFEMENLSQTPVTVRLQLVSQGLKADRSLPLLAELGPGERSELVRLTKIGHWQYRYWYSWSRGRFSARHDDSARYRLPWSPDQAYWLLQGWGDAFSHTEPHSFYAIDVAMPEGSEVRAARAGLVVQVREDSDQGCPERRCVEDANYLVIEHEDGTLAEYFHLARHGVLVEPGQQVAAGQLIARSGNTGFSTEPHLHFVVKTVSNEAKPVSLPVIYLSDRGEEKRLQRGRRYRPPPLD
uniref:M23 family metallopeptidase n=1 Tax=Gallaecimonas sp. GXIMD4217 TaxID=3131927 RepID=UPI00404A679C